MAESPLFKSLPIGSLRYWSQVSTVIDTQICSAVDLQLQRDNFLFNFNDTPLLFDFQNTEFRLELSQGFEFVNQTEGLTYEVCS